MANILVSSEKKICLGSEAELSSNVDVQNWILLEMVFSVLDTIGEGCIIPFDRISVSLPAKTDDSYMCTSEFIGSIAD